MTSRKIQSFSRFSSQDTLPSFVNFWRPIFSLDINIWHRWMHTHSYSQGFPVFLLLCGNLSISGTGGCIRTGTVRTFLLFVVVWEIINIWHRWMHTHRYCQGFPAFCCCVGNYQYLAPVDAYAQVQSGLSCFLLLCGKLSISGTGRCLGTGSARAFLLFVVVWEIQGLEINMTRLNNENGEWMAEFLFYVPFTPFIENICKSTIIILLRKTMLRITRNSTSSVAQ